MKKQKCRALSLLLLIALLFALTGAMPAAATERAKTIRVGFFAFEGYHNQEADGTRSGYGYEYLQQMARYTGWSYEYVGYDKSWGEAQKMLENGEIDLLTSAQKTAAREEIFDFSDDPIGYSSTLFTIKSGDTRYTIDNFSTFNGIRVGMIEGNSRNTEFAAFAAEKGFTYTPIMFSDNNVMVDALQDQSIDSIVTSSLRVIHGEWVVSEFGFSPYYVCVKKGNQALLDQVNDAIGKLNQNNPSLQNELENKYYGTDSGQEVAFTEEERRYITNLKMSGQALKVIINPDRAPLSYYQNGEPSGIFGEVAERILERSGLPFRVVEVPDRETYTQYREDHTADLCMDMRLDLNQAEQSGYRLTDSYYSATISRVTLAGNEGEVRSVAAIENSDIAEKVSQKYHSQAEIVYYATGDECVQAVRQGKQDATYLYTYVAEKALETDVTHRLNTTLVPDFSTEFCVGISNISDTVLFSILNKSVNSIAKSWMDERTVAYTENQSRVASLTELVYYHPIAALILVAVFVALLWSVILMLVRQKAQRQAEEQAREIQRLFSYVCSANEKVLEVNLATMRSREFFMKDNVLCTEEREFRTADNYNDFMYPEDYAAVGKKLTMESMNELIRNGQEFVFEARSRNAKGDYQWYIYTIRGMVPDALHPFNFMLFKRDVNELKLTQEENRKALMDALRVAKEASEAKGTFMSRMSHEIRTPLNAVIGYLTLMRDCLTEPPKVEDYVNKCQSAARHLLSIINDVLDISAIESGKIKIASEPFDLKELLSNVSLMFYNQAKAKGVEFKVEIQDLTHERVVGDQLRLNQILMNLLSNAMKFTPKGGTVRLAVRQLPTNSDQARICFEVSDTGIGMSKEFMGRIFSPFEQEKAETARKYGGSGLGLSITNNLVTMMRGSIKVDSEAGKGTQFTVYLTFDPVAEEEKRAPSDFSRVRALIVDDESHSCDYMKALLKRCHVKSDMVLSGEAALRQIMKREGTDYEYNLCLIDWNMPGMNGVETARRIRQECKKDIPIIIASAYDTSEIRDAALEAGVNRLISKPLFQSTMFDLLVETFGKYDPLITAARPEKHVDFAGVRVLLAEDNPMNQEIAVSILKKSGLVIDTAADGKQALDQFTASRPGTYQVILMDIQMPVMDGYEATRAIRSSAHPQAKSIPIVAMTANAFTEDVTAALNSGMNDHISKPVNYDKLYQILQKYLKAPKE